MPDETSHESASVQLAPGVAVSCAIPELDGAVELGVEHADSVVQSELIKPEDGPKPFVLNIGRLAIELSLGADNASGAVRASGSIGMRSRITRRLRTVADVDRVLFRYAPTHGSVGGRTEPDPPIFDDPAFGKSRMSSKNVTRIFVDDHERVLSDVGRLVKKALWPDYPDWVFNTVACVGAFDEQGRGAYTNPDSNWFNVFLGYYQIDAPKPDWSRPFAYESANGAASKVRFDEVVRLGKSDWNYFSNWMYGVPGEVVARHNDFDVDRLTTLQEDAGRIGSSRWHRVAIGGVEFVSSYESDAPGADELVRNSLASGAWRKAFGPPNPRPDHRVSFIPATLDADMYMAYWEDDEAFHTVMFGGTAPSGGDPRFLSHQLAESRRVIKRSFADIGFEPGGS